MEQPEDDGLEGERKRKRIWVEWHEVVLVVWSRPEPFRSQVVYVTERVIRACIISYTKRQDQTGPTCAACMVEDIELVLLPISSLVMTEWDCFHHMNGLFVASSLFNLNTWLGRVNEVWSCRLSQNHDTFSFLLDRKVQTRTFNEVWSEKRKHLAVGYVLLVLATNWQLSTWVTFIELLKSNFRYNNRIYNVYFAQDNAL
jgi:hypothetical protein